MIRITDMTKYFGGVTALKGLSFQVGENELMGIIGPNGSGKTTLINIVTGMLRPDRGTVFFREKRIDRLAPYEIARRGLGRTFQVTRVFRRMNVLDNMMVSALSVPRVETRRELVEKALDTLSLLKLVHLKNEQAGNLSGGQHKLLELGRVLMLDPEVIFLDEPFAGVHPELKGELHRHIRALHAMGRTIILVSHDMHSIFSLSRRILVVSYGEKIADGTPDEIRDNEEVVEAYLGRANPCDAEG